MSKLGRRMIRALKEFIRKADDGEPVEQIVMRRMKVKGKTVYTREKFKAPIRRQA